MTVKRVVCFETKEGKGKRIITLRVLVHDDGGYNDQLAARFVRMNREWLPGDFAGVWRTWTLNEFPAWRSEPLPQEDRVFWVSPGVFTVDWAGLAAKTDDDVAQIEASALKRRTKPWWVANYGDVDDDAED
jgi:hypothetical protein